MIATHPSPQGPLLGFAAWFLDNFAGPQPLLVWESIRLLAFVGAVGGVFGAALVIALRRRPARTRSERSILALAALGLACVAYGRFVEPYRLEVTRVRVASSKIPPGAPPLRIVHFSDTHCDPAPRLETRLPALIESLKPDLVAFTGDTVNSAEGLPVFRNLFSRVAAAAPTFAVQGNWDSWHWKGLAPFSGTGARELNGDSASLNIRGVRVRVAGVAVDNEAALPRALEGADPRALSVYLQHYPDEIEEAAARKADLYLAGHTHGGQVALPLYGAIITFSRFGKRFESGLHRVRDTWLYVNRGIGMEGGGAPRVRFWARPELTVIDVVPSN